MILKFKEPVYEYLPDPDYPDGPKIRGPVVGCFVHIFGEVSEVEYIDKFVDESYITADGEDRPGIKVDSWIRDHAKTKFKLVHFDTQNGRKTVAFNTTAYLCSNTGDTVDTLKA